MVITKGQIHTLNKPVAFDTTFVTTRYSKVNEKQAVKGGRYSEK